MAANGQPTDIFGKESTQVNSIYPDVGLRPMASVLAINPIIQRVDTSETANHTMNDINATALRSTSTRMSLSDQECTARCSKLISIQ